MPRTMPICLACLAVVPIALLSFGGVAHGDVRLVVGVRAGAARIAGAGTTARVPGLPAVLVRTPTRAATATARRLRRLPGVRYVERDGVVHALETGPDPGRPLQWGLDAVGADVAWNVTRGTGVTVAVVDTGVAPAPDLAGRLLPGWNVLTADANAADDNRHGTHVAGTIAEDAGNTLAEAGLAPEAQILPVKVLDATGSGSDSDVAAGIAWAATHGARVINLSLGAPAPSHILADAVRSAVSHGVTVVAAAGNDGGRPGYPARLPGVIAVGAIDRSLAVAAFSARGRGLDLVAPGVGVVQQTLGDRPGSWSEQSFDGTSMAAPHVSATAALVLASGRATTPATVALRLERTAQDLGQRGWDSASGFGLVRADLAVAR
jgi:subtilisin family serine protease